ncbi:MAG: DegT/DnrJ/EryC1/StrS family aminotransferase, partial [Muribaculaceae bacterium]|nr:DegT/DnrJ/EryC1/StrS family aminotransferase [Muribaculaceae bacterium]
MIPFLDLKAVNDRFGDQISRAINRVADSGLYIGGPELDRFENLMKEITGAPEVVPVANGTDALTLILEGLITLGQLKPGDQIIIPANTYIASFMAVWRAGLRPVPVDADPLTMNIDFSKIEDSISPATKAIMTVHLYGLIAFDPILIDLKNRYGLVIIEDCAQAIGAKSIIKG